MPLLETEISEEYGREFVYLDDLQDLSPLHSLVVTGAPLAMVRLVYQADPAVMTDDVFRDACWHCPRSDVIEFLKGHVVDPSVLEPKRIAEIMWWMQERGQQEKFETLFVAFPEVLMYSNNPKQTNSPFTEAFNILTGKCEISDAFLSKMIQYLPISSKRIDVSMHWTPGEMDGTRSALASKVQDMPNLEFLKLPIHLGDSIDCNMVEAISSKIASGLLQSLEIDSSMESDTEEGFFLPLLNALAKAGDASNLKEFKLTVLQATSAGTKQTDTYQDRVIEILQWNTTLTNVEINWCTKWRTIPKKRKKGKVIDYYTALNRCGTQEGICDKQLVPMLYGLLREAPDKWISSCGGKGNNAAEEKRSGLKRKASSSLDQSAFKR
ncbi:expressed unknown protein [Seminavis robusta]|uniref:Uncharacterized protein n=1 Tax=Seminavis robusta TaxID=568900 RepID=A0A9N8ELI0_9STRA|nr:expressed unknown protein [Seminavis robusta]|eukprot:Sro1166_g248230.1 n/a (381) ;mRNA; f:14597-15817